MKDLGISMSAQGLSKGEKLEDWHTSSLSNSQIALAAKPPRIWVLSDPCWITADRFNV
jgi:hypothetical protein